MGKALPRGIRLKRGKFQARVMVGGQHAAQTFAKLEDAIAYVESVRSLRGAQPEKFETLGALMDDMLRDARENLSEGTQDYWKRHFDAIRLAWPESTPLHAITPDAILAYLAAEKRRPSSSTAGKRYAALSKIFDAAIRRRYLVSSPLADIKNVTDRPTRATPVRPNGATWFA